MWVTKDGQSYEVATPAQVLALVQWLQSRRAS